MVIYNYYYQSMIQEEPISSDIANQQQFQGSLFFKNTNNQQSSISKILPTSNCLVQYEFNQNTQTKYLTVCLQLRDRFLVLVNKMLTFISAKQLWLDDRFQVFRAQERVNIRGQEAVTIQRWQKVWKISGIKFKFANIPSPFSFFIDDNKESMNCLNKFVTNLSSKYIIQQDAKKYFICIKCIAKTRCSVVNLCKRKYDNQQVILKCYRKSNYLSDPRNMLTFKRQVKITALMKHQNIIKQFGVFESQNKFYIVLEYHSSTLLQSVRKNKINDQESIVKILQKLVEAVAYIHSKGIMHRDLKPANIVMKDTKQNILEPVIIDFGMATQADGKVQTQCGTAGFIAPEIFKHNQPYNQKCDIFSLGAILYYMITKRNLFDGESQDAIYNANKQNEIDTRFPHMTDSARDILIKMLDKNPENRPSANQILDHPFLKVENNVKNLQSPKRKRGNSIRL